MAVPDGLSDLWLCWPQLPQRCSPALVPSLCADLCVRACACACVRACVMIDNQPTAGVEIRPWLMLLHVLSRTEYEQYPNMPTTATPTPPLNQPWSTLALRHGTWVPKSYAYS